MIIDIIDDKHKKFINFKNECNFPKIIPLKNIFINKISIINNSILILEQFPFHYECTPGFTKYFIDLGYNVDIIIDSIGITTFCFFEYLNKIRLFIYDKFIDFKKNFANFTSFFKKYKYILIETATPTEFNLYNNFNFFSINKALFVFHHIDYANFSVFKNKLKSYQKLSLGNFPSFLKVNPHYFGNFVHKNKNKVTTFFITSTPKRNYKFLVNALEKLKNDSLKFHVIVVGKWHTFSKAHIKKILQNDLTFKYQISYYELYKQVYNSDFIIINLDPKNIEDIMFNKIRVTGSAQLVHGFLKPTFIHKDFAKFYDFDYSNSIIYDNYNFTKAMKYAINMENHQYKKLQENLSLLSKKIYRESLYNLKSCLKEY